MGNLPSNLLNRLLGPALGGITFFLLQHLGNDPALVGGLAVCMAYWWITEAISIYFTALIPITFFPMLGIMPIKQVAVEYMPQIIFLFVGGFILAFALEKWNLHKRIALKIILLVGTTPDRILLGFMLASYLLSMWILNTATVMMLLPALLAVIGQMESVSGGSLASRKATPYLLGLAYASSIGGTATLIGTAPNLVLLEFYGKNFPDGPPITFANWMLFGVPLSLVLFAATYFILRFIYFRKDRSSAIDLDYCKQEYRRLGPLNYEEKVLAVLYSITVLMWFFAKDLNLGGITISGWTNLLPEPKYVTESSIAMFSAFLLFLIPSGKGWSKALIDWEEAKRIPYGVILLFGGGFALSKGMQVTGLGAWIGESFQQMGNLPIWLVVAALAVFMTFFTELTSNTASTTLMLTILIPIVSKLGWPALTILLPVTVSASFAFMLPVATPPNTIVFGSERLSVRDMARTGIWVNIAAIILVVIFSLTLGRYLFEG